jgi:predicted metal-dependent phosphoesterase TrpH
MSVRLVSPYLDSGFEWVRGNLHTHTTNSDGSLSPEDTVRAYADAGYGFLCLSDHDTLTWPVSAPSSIIMVPGVEVGGGPHILTVNVEEVISYEDDRQAVIDQAIAAGGIAILNHPNWGCDFDHFPQAEIEALHGYAGIEIYNGVVDVLEGSALATDRWDRMLARGVPAWGFAHDDTHLDRLIGRAWLVAQVRERSRAGVMEALTHGRFYASTGVDIRRIAIGPDTISVQAPNAQRIRFIGAWGRLLHEADDCEAGFRIGGREGGYVRVECLGRGGRCAWSQPIQVVTEPDAA